MRKMLPLFLTSLILCCCLSTATSIEGTIMAPLNAAADWISHTRVRVDGQKYLGFVKPDGSFIVSNVPSGSYLVEITNPSYLFQPVRVDINSKGKIRARRTNLLQTNTVKSVAYPLRIASVGKAMYFQPREQLRTLDLLLNPTVLLMVLPLLFVMVLPKMMDLNDPELKEMQQNSILNKPNTMPGLSDLLSTLSTGGESSERGSRRSDADDQQQSALRKGGRKRN